MKCVYVINKNGNPLMPCKPAKAKHLLRDAKARVVKLNPFTIQLLWDCEENIQEVIVGLDTGANRVGCSAVTKDGKVLYQSETILRDNISKLMTQRREYRITRRNRKTRYRKPRFNNRKRPKGWLPPSLKSKADSTVKVVAKLSEILPFKTVRVEIAKFETIVSKAQKSKY
ncbi:MAG: RNA-guided endonuclease IscB [Methanosarcinales archaeon]